MDRWNQHVNFHYSYGFFKHVGFMGSFNAKADEGR